jgi:hypothetical protein
MHSLINTQVLPGTTVNTDEFGGYKGLCPPVIAD